MTAAAAVVAVHCVCGRNCVVVAAVVAAGSVFAAAAVVFERWNLTILGKTVLIRLCSTAEVAVVAAAGVGVGTQDKEDVVAAAAAAALQDGGERRIPGDDGPFDAQCLLQPRPHRSR